MGGGGDSSSKSSLDLRPEARHVGVTASARMLVAPREQAGSEILEGTFLENRGRWRDECPG